MKRSILLPVALAVILAGCSTAVRVRGDAAAIRSVKRVAILDFDDSAIGQGIRDRAAYGVTTEPDVGKLISGLLGKALAEKKIYEVLRGREVLMALKKRNISVAAVGQVPPPELATLINVDAVITGRVLRHAKAWYWYSSATEVAFGCQCAAAGSGRLLWAARADGTSLFAVEQEHYRIACEKIVDQLAKPRLKPLVSAAPAPKTHKRHPLLKDLTLPRVPPELRREALPFSKYRRTK